MPDDWSTVALTKAVDNGLLNGYKINGKTYIQGQNPMTRAEMAAVISRTFGANVKADLSGAVDIVAEEWYANEMAKAVKMKAFSMDTKIRPNDNITREEAFVVLARVFKIEGSDDNNLTLNIFSDENQISGWAKRELKGMVEAGYIKGSHGKLFPLAAISRAEFAVVMDNLVKQYITEPGIITEVVSSGNVLVRSPGVTLKNLTVKGDLIIADGVGEDEAILEGVKVKGKTIVRGGGVNSLIIRGDTNIGKVILSKTTGDLRVIVEGDTDIKTLYVDDGSQDVILQGIVGFMEIAGDNITVRAELSMKDRVLITGNNSFVIFEDVIIGDTLLPASGGRNPGGGRNPAPIPVSVSCISLNPTEMILTAGGIKKIAVTINPSNATNQNIVWSSGDISVATVDQDGLVTGVTIGATTINVTSADNSSILGTSRITVGYYVENVEQLKSAIENAVNGDAIILAAGEYQLTETLEITKSIQIIGPQANVAPRGSEPASRTVDNNEAILTGDKGDTSDPISKKAAIDANWLDSIFKIKANNVVINGLTVERTKNSLISATTTDNLTGLQIINNIVRQGRGNEGIKVQKAINPLIENNYIKDIRFGGDAIEVIEGTGFRIINNEIDGCDSENGTIRVKNKIGGEAGIVQNNLIKNTRGHFAITAYEGNGNITIDNNIIKSADTGGIFIYKNQSVSEDNLTIIDITNNTIDNYGTSPASVSVIDSKKNYLIEAASAISVSFNLNPGIQPKVTIRGNTTTNGASGIPVLAFGGGTPDDGAKPTDLSNITVSGNNFDTALIKNIKITGTAISI